ncbi:helix-turn-helix transcriptional regulator [Paenibacillus sp. GCM10027627]|uniref:helix-turn-helix transcriptional regulator n=1 Tax=unclassified Paenibacillus TaxID=185978 RepID=UPI00362BECCA
MKWDRLLGITMELMTNKRVSATELAARFQVSVRTIYRDIDAINEAGIPVASYSGTVGGFELMDGFYLSKQHFSIEDFIVMYQLLRGGDNTGGSQVVSLIHKLGSLQPSLLQGLGQPSYLLDISAAEEEKDDIGPLYEAVQQKRIVSFSYANSAGEETERQVEPSRLYWERGWWYLEGYCLLRQAKRCFRVSRIEGLVSLEEHFAEREKEHRPHVWEERGGLAFQAHLRFEDTSQPRVIACFPGQCMHHGTYIDVHTVFYSMAYAVSVVLSFGSAVSILAPEDLKERLVKEVEHIQLKYKN